MGTMISFSRPDGGNTQGYLAEAGGDRPSVVVIQDAYDKFMDEM